MSVDHTNSMAFGDNNGRFLDRRGNEGVKGPTRTLGCTGQPQPVSANSRTFIRNKRHASSYYCDHCKVLGHNKERCWKLNSYPLNYKPNTNTWRRNGNGNTRANAVQSENASRDLELINTSLTPHPYK